MTVKEVVATLKERDLVKVINRSGMCFGAFMIGRKDEDFIQERYGYFPVLDKIIYDYEHRPQTTWENSVEVGRVVYLIISE